MKITAWAHKAGLWRMGSVRRAFLEVYCFFKLGVIGGRYRGEIECLVKDANGGESDEEIFTFLHPRKYIEN